MNHGTIMSALMTIVDELSGKSEVATNVYSGDDKRRFAPVSIETDSDESHDTPLDVMVPPLQQKLELLKKSVGVDNVFDTSGGCPASCDCEACSATDIDYEDEMKIIRNNAGINPNVTAIMALSDDEPLD